MRPPGTELGKWAFHLTERRRLEDFLTWLQEHYRETEVLDLHPRDVLDVYHGIDRQQLEAERLALLEAQHQLNSGARDQ